MAPICIIYLIFTDEAGAYKGQTTPEFRKRHPFYVRSNVMLQGFSKRNAGP